MIKNLVSTEFATKFKRKFKTFFRDTWRSLCKVGRSISLLWTSLICPAILIEHGLINRQSTGVGKYHASTAWVTFSLLHIFINFSAKCFAFSAWTLFVGLQKVHPACKNWVMGCWRGYVWSKVQIVCIWSSWSHCIRKPQHLLPHLNLDWFIFLVPAYPGCPGKEAVKRV